MKGNILEAVGFRKTASLYCQKEKSTEIEECLSALKSYDKYIRGIAINQSGVMIDDCKNPVSLRLETQLEKPAAARKYPLFMKVEDGKVAAYCIPVVGKGLWSTIYGYIALEPDMNTVRGISFYKHGETPGLGSEIESEKFHDHFKGKKIFTEAGQLKSIRVIKGGVKKKSKNLIHEVDGISGATLTGDGVTKLLASSLALYEPYMKIIRKGAQVEK